MCIRDSVKDCHCRSTLLFGHVKENCYYNVVPIWVKAIRQYYNIKVTSQQQRTLMFTTFNAQKIKINCIVVMILYENICTFE